MSADTALQGSLESFEVSDQVEVGKGYLERDRGFYKKEGAHPLTAWRCKRDIGAVENQSSVFKNSNMYFFSALLGLCLSFQTLACGPGLHIRIPEDDKAYAPIPAGSKGIPLVNNYGVQAFGKGAYMVTDGSYQGS
jgi:hypothetical protein